MKLFNVLLSIILAGFLLFSCQPDKTRDLSLEEIWKVHNKILTIDSHTDTPLRLMRPGTDLSRENNPKQGGGKLDFPRMKKGGLDGVFFAVFIGQGERNAEKNLEAKNRALMIFDSIHNVLNQHSGLVELATSSSDLERISKTGKQAVYIGIENGYPVGNDLSLIKQFFDLGARYITLCHTRNNDICDSSTDPAGPEHDGLSKFGEEVIREMNNTGIMIDVSHISDEAFYDILEITRAPVIASHSCARALCDHPRNLDDEMLKALAENGGVIQMCFVSEYLIDIDPYPERDSARRAVMMQHGNYYELDQDSREAFMKDWLAVDSIFPPHLANVSDLVDHIDHVVQLTGIDHVGIGSDFDGGGELENCYDVAGMPAITGELLRRGYTHREIEKIWSGNLLRVFREVERVSGGMRRSL